MASPQAKLIEYLPSSQRQRLLLRLMRQRGGRRLHQALSKVHPADTARLFPLLRPDERMRILEILFDLHLAAPTLRELDTDTQRQLVAEIPDPKLAAILQRLSADDAVDLLEDLDPERRELLLESLDRPLAARLRNLMLYGGETAGGLMNPDVIFFRADQTVEDTLEVVRELAGSRRLFYLYVTDDRGHLIGLVNLWQLLTATRESVLREIMSSDVVSVQADTPQEEVARVFTRYDLLMMPVRDEDGRLVGAITVDDVIDVIEEEASADLYRLGNLPAQEGLGTPLSRSLRLRLPWLLTQLAMAIPAALVVSWYQETLVKYVLLAAFFPMILATGTYAGTQTLTVMVASLAGGEMDLRQVWQVVAKQAALGLVNGLVSGLALGLAGWLWERNLILAGVLLVAQIVNMLLAALLGATIPLLLHRFKLDPALGSPIVVSALAHLGGLASFLALVSLFLARLI